jgi:hypothetical protein
MAGTLGDMKANIVLELDNRSDLTTEIANAISFAITHYQPQKFYFTEKSTTVTTTLNTATTALPTDLEYIDGVTIIYSTFPIAMERRSWATMLEMMVNTTALTGQPTDYAIYENKFYWWPTPNGAYTVTVYENFQNAAPVSDAATGNNWMVDAEELIRSRAKSDIECNILHKQNALLEMAQVADDGYLSFREKIAHRRLQELTTRRISSGRIKPSPF